MAGFADYLETKVLNHVFGIATFTSPSDYYIALFIALPNDDGTGGTEVSGGGYSRVDYTLWANDTGDQVYNSQAITFPKATADWGTVVGAGIYDAASAGNFLAFGSLSSSVDVLQNDQVIFQPGAFVIKMVD